jgi:hypothetical protein
MFKANNIFGTGFEILIYIANKIEKTIWRKLQRVNLNEYYAGSDSNLEIYKNA